MKKLVVLAQFRRVSRTTHHGHLLLWPSPHGQLFVNGNNVEEAMAVNIYHIELSHGNLSHGKLAMLSCCMASWLWRNDCGEMAAPGRLRQDGHNALAVASCPTILGCSHSFCV